MYASMMMDGIRNRKSRKIRVFHGTIRLKRKNNDVFLKKSIFEKVHLGMFEKRSDPKDPSMSMLIAQDTESSRVGFVNQETLVKPYSPHYHFLIIVPSEEIHVPIRNLMMHMKSKILELDEVDSAEGSVWIGIGNPKSNRKRRYKDPISDLIDYDTKTFVHAKHHGDFDYEPSVFPYQINPEPVDHQRVSRTFERLIDEQAEFETNIAGNRRSTVMLRA